MSDARTGGADGINKKLSRKLVSDSTCSYSDARQRWPWEFLLQVLSLQARKIIGLSPTTRWRGLVIALLDGSTVRLRPYGRIAKEFPPNRNQHRRPYWCLMRVLVCFCALSGAALDCAIGSIHVSEQVRACRIILASLAKCLFIGDRNFGVFGVVQAARQAGQQVLLRMTDRRARKLLGRALRAGEHEVRWEPTRQDQLEPDCSKEPLEGRLLVVRLQRKDFRSQLLCLFTTLPNTADYPLQRVGAALRAALAHRTGLALLEGPNESGAVGGQISGDGAKRVAGRLARLQSHPRGTALRCTAKGHLASDAVLLLRSQALGMLVASVRPHQTPSQRPMGRNPRADGPLPAPAPS